MKAPPGTGVEDRVYILCVLIANDALSIQFLSRLMYNSCLLLRPRAFQQSEESFCTCNVKEINFFRFLIFVSLSTYRACAESVMKKLQESLTLDALLQTLDFR